MKKKAETSLSRREFIKKNSAAAAALVVLPILDKVNNLSEKKKPGTTSMKPGKYYKKLAG